jgi:exopolysaccharide biosynthesis polyprenyl glycosylphosphotransferase
VTEGGPLEQLFGGQGFVSPLPDASAALDAGDAVLDLTGREPVIDVRPAERDTTPALELVEAPAGLPAAPAWQLALKRTADIVLSAIGLVVLLPLLAVIALLVGLTSRGPVLFVQERVGRNGARFKLLKFRSMQRDAHERRHEHLDLNHQHGPVFKIRNDPRVTPVGRVLRRLSLDELPQLANVLVGHMSLVGPRPPLPEEYEQFTARERRRLSVKPGVTCIWQVSGRSDLDFETWVDMDLEYIDRWSPLLDAELLLRTVPAVLRRRGAY